MPSFAITHGLHLFLAVLFYSATFADVFFLRSTASTMGQPQELFAGWRMRVALLEMFLFTFAIVLGLIMWFPAAASYSSPIFHSKIGLAVIYLVLGKVRMLKERRTQMPAIGITRIMGLVVTLILCLGIYGGLSR